MRRGRREERGIDAVDISEQFQEECKGVQEGV